MCRKYFRGDLHGVRHSTKPESLAALLGETSDLEFQIGAS